MDESLSLDALAGLLEQLADNPRNFSVHVQHIRLAKSLEGLEAEAASASALEMFTNCFAAGDEVWLELLDIKERSVNLDTVNGIEEILALYQRAEADYLSIPVLKRHIEFILRRYEHYSDEAIKPDELGELFSKEWTRTAVTDIVNKGIGHITQSHLLWNLLRDWELEILESSSASEKPSLVEHLEAFLLERLSQPHAHADDTFQAYSSFTTNYKPASQYESLLVAASKVKARIQKAVERRDPHEDALNRSRNSLEAFERYIAYERKAKYPDLAITSAVYERAISEAAKRKFQGEPGSEEALRAFWVGYSDALRLLNTGKDLQVDLFKRAVRSVPECGEIWARYIRCIERYTDPEHMKEERNAVSALFVQACEVPQLLQNVEQLVALILARAGFEKRLIDLGLSDDETIPTLIGILESGIEMVRKTQSGDPRLRLENYLVELYRFAGVPESSVAVWQLAAKHYKNSYFVWTSYTDCLIKTDRHDEARKVFSDIAAKQIDWPEAIWEAWSLFEHFHGSVEQIEACLDKIEKARYQVNIRRLKEAEKANHLAMQVIAESQAAPAPVSELVATAPTEDSMEVDVANGSRGTKRAAEDTTDENSHKKTKLEPPLAPLKRDRENSTVFVADIPNNVTEEELTNVFKDCGRVREVKITKLSSATVATIEFMDRESVPAALTKDKKKISEQEIAVHLAWQSTLYVTNFPENADDSYIRNLFGKYGTIFDVRWPSKKFKNTRRFCYVQFTSPTSAQASLELHGQELEPDRVINVLISNPGRKKERTDQDANDRELHVAGLSKQTTKHDLQKLFTKFGPVKDIRMAMDNDGKFRGFAFVEFENESHARAALDANNQELKGRRMAITIADSRGKSRPRTFDTERGLGRNAELASRSIRVKNLPVNTQEGVLQQMFEKFVSVKRLELFEDVHEAVVELESPADVGKLLLQPEPITFNGASLQLIEEVPAPRKPDGDSRAGTFIPRKTISKPRAGLGHKQKPATPINSAGFIEAKTMTNVDSTSGGKSQDDFRKLLGGK